MKVKVEIDIEPKEYFNYLCEVAINDVKKSTNRAVDIEALIEGYHYVKSLKNNKLSVNISMIIGPLIRNKLFCVKYETKDTKGEYYYDFITEGTKNYVVYYEETNYKKKTIGNYFGNLRKRIKAKITSQRTIQNIDLTTTYIKNNMK